MRGFLAFLAVVFVFAAALLHEEVRAGAVLNPEMQALVDGYLKDAQKSEPGLKAFSAAEGKRFFSEKRMNAAKKEERSCATCHTEDPKNQGKTTVGKPIEPMAPSVNKGRFIDPRKVEKWFKRNCEWVLERECSPKEKGDYIAYMFSL
ncbi:MAG: DUF1924 domain-containing protein [Deltaproteobacteria bacterium]